MTWIGIDVSKSKLDVYVAPSGLRLCIDNDEDACRKLAMKLRALGPKRIVVEATGGYEQTVADAVRREGLEICVVNPRQIRDFGRALGRLHKTDRADAEVIALAAERLDLRATPPMSESQRNLRKWLRRRAQVVEALTVERNRLSTCRDVDLRAHIDEHVEWLRAQIVALDKTIDACLAVVGDEAAPQQTLREIKGVGRIVLATLLAELPELGRLSRKTIASIVGLAPYARDSGSSIRGARSIRGGRAEVRNALYMATLHAIRRDPIIRPHYLKLREEKHKPGKVALTACMRKLLVILNAKTRDHLAAA